MAAFTVLHAAPAAAQDTVVVHANNPPVWGEDVRFTEELRIGMLEGPEEYTFGGISSVAVGNEGNMFVLDYQVPAIRRYDSEGRYLGDVGRPGQGPGEYRAVLGMRVLHNGHLAAWDVGNTRITVYDTAGQYIDSHRVPSGLYTSETFFVDTAGYYYVLATDMGRRRHVPLREQRTARGVVTLGGGEVPKLLIKVSPAGDLVDSIRLPLEEKGPAFVLMTADGARWNFPTAVCYTRSPLGYAVLGRNDPYAFDIAMANGSVTRVERDYEPVALHRQERNQWEARADRFERRGAERFDAIPSRKPAYRDLYVGDDGRIWVERYVEAVKRDVKPREPGDTRPILEWREASSFDVFEPDGTFLGSVTAPESTRILVRRGDRVWGVYRDDYDVEYVVRFLVEGTRN